MFMYRIVVIAFMVLFMASLGCGKGDTGEPGQSIVGPQGVAGTNGKDGKDGVDASPVAPIALCSSFTPSYPNSFPEYALCLQGHLYGVYSDHGGFLALLPPGVYSSNGINASCTFTVQNNCVVIH